jgi:pyruvate dehydrogenase (quinone)
VLADDLPWVTGSIGLLGTTASWELMRGCDTLLTVGSNFPYTQFLPDLDAARAVQIDRSGKWIGMRYPYEINLVGDAKTTLRALIPLLHRKSDRSWREKIEAAVDDWWTTVQRTAMTDADPLNPMRLFWELSQRLPSNAIVTADSGSAAIWYARHLKFTDGMRGSLSGTLATMGPAVPYAIGAKWAQPDRPAIAFVGDGAMQMNGMAELITIAKYWTQWADPRLIIAVLHKNDLNKVTWEMRAMENSPKFEESQTLPDVDYAAFARSIGLNGENLSDAGQLGDAWDRALASDRPTVLDVLCDPDVPPIPPHATFEQAKSMAHAVVGGDEDAAGFIKQGVKQKVQQYFPREKKTP